MDLAAIYILQTRMIEQFDDIQSQVIDYGEQVKFNTRMLDLNMRVLVQIMEASRSCQLYSAINNFPAPVSSDAVAAETLPTVITSSYRPPTL